jgi:hypothetical protein
MIAMAIASLILVLLPPPPDLPEAISSNTVTRASILEYKSPPTETAAAVTLADSLSSSIALLCAPHSIEGVFHEI